MIVLWPAVLDLLSIVSMGRGMRAPGGPATTGLEGFWGARCWRGLELAVLGVKEACSPELPSEPHVHVLTWQWRWGQVIYCAPPLRQEPEVQEYHCQLQGGEHSSLVG
jgi:hypothetical protein